MRSGVYVRRCGCSGSAFTLSLLMVADVSSEDDDSSRPYMPELFSDLEERLMQILNELLY